MKKSKFIAALIIIIFAIVLILGSCTKNEIPIENQLENQIIGKWINPEDSTLLTFKTDSKVTVKLPYESSTTGIYYFNNDTIHIWSGATKNNAIYINGSIRFMSDKVFMLNDSILYYKK